MLAVVYYMNVVKRCKAFYSGDNQLQKKRSYAKSTPGYQETEHHTNC